MTKLSEKLTAHEYVWAYRIRQRIELERIVLTVGSTREKNRAKRFLEAMEQANPELFEDVDLHIPELLDNTDYHTPELFDESEYAKAKGRKTALKLPQDILWEDKIVRRAVREYRDLFHPCENSFSNAMKGLQYLNKLHPELFSRARAQSIDQKQQILNFEIFCKCDCTSKEDREPAGSFKTSNHGRFKNVSKRIASARQALESPGQSSRDDWTFFLDRIREIAAEMLES